MRIAVFNQKGGVGKTTTTLNLAAALSIGKLETLLIDLDPQAHLSAMHGLALGDSARSIFAHFLDNTPLSALQLDWPGIGGLIPAHAELIKVDSVFGKGPNVVNKLNQGLNELNDPRHCVLIDCCPFLGVLSLNAIFAADCMLVPVSSDFLSLRAAGQIEHTLKALEPVMKRRMVRRFVLTRFDRRRKMSFEIRKKLQERFGSEVCETVISENVAIAEAPAYGRNIFTHDAASRGAADYLALTGELRDCGFM